MARPRLPYSASAMAIVSQKVAVKTKPRGDAVWLSGDAFRPRGDAVRLFPPNTVWASTHTMQGKAKLRATSELRARAKLRAKAGPKPRAKAKLRARAKLCAEAKAKPRAKAKASAGGKRLASAKPRAKAKARAGGKRRASAKPRAKAKARSGAKPRASAKLRAKAKGKPRRKATIFGTVADLAKWTGLLPEDLRHLSREAQKALVNHNLSTGWAGWSPKHRRTWKANASSEAEKKRIFWQARGQARGVVLPNTRFGGGR